MKQMTQQVMKKMLTGLALLAVVPLPAPAWAQSKGEGFPARSVTLIVPFAPGGNDAEARLEATKMSELMGQPFVVDYKPGAGSTVGTAHVARAAPDGYTLLVASGPFTSLSALYKDLGFDPVKDFAPVSLMSKRTTVMLVYPGFVAKTFPEYIAYAKANPSKVNFGTAGVGATVHLAGAWIHSATSTKVTFIHHKGSGPMLTELAAGRIDVAPANLLVATAQIKSGKARVLAVMSDTRSPLLPGVPTIAEQGIPGYDYASWLGYIAPAGTPAAVVNRLSEGFARVAKSPDIAKRFENEGAFMIGSTPAEFRKMIVAETERWNTVVRENQIKPEE